MCTTRRSIVYHLVDDRSARHAGLIALAAGVAATVPKIIETRIAIKASPSKVWSILTNFSAMPSWNPFITAISGNVLLGTRLS
jgi:Polyketide cyclase / dehydrase and lipid transport